MNFPKVAKRGKITQEEIMEKDVLQQHFLDRLVHILALRKQYSDAVNSSGVKLFYIAACSTVADCVEAGCLEEARELLGQEVQTSTENKHILKFFANKEVPIKHFVTFIFTRTRKELVKVTP